MTRLKGPPCSSGLDADCFKAQPVWAKQALAARLMHLLTPKQLSRRLQRVLRPALIAPGVALAPGLELPPGVVVTPDATFPPGWTPGDPLPPGVIQDPAAIADVTPGTITPPQYTTPWEPGPINQPGKQPAPSVEYFFYEPFDNLTDNSWSDLSQLGGSISIVSSTLKLYGIGTDSLAIARTTEAATWPTNLEITFRVKIVSGSNYAQVEFRDGTYRNRIVWTPPSTINILPRVGSCSVDVGNYLNTWHNFIYQRSGAFSTLKMDGTPIISSCDTFLSGSGAGRIECYQRGIGESYIDYETIVEL